MRKVILSFVFLLAFSGLSYSQNIFSKFKHYIDKAELKGLDTNYVCAHKRKWSVFANSYFSVMDFDMRSRLVDIEEEEIHNGRSVINMRSNTDKQVSLGLYYMGYGLSYSLSLGKGFKKDLSFQLYSSPAGGEFRYHTTRNIKGDFITPSGEEMKLMGEEATMENIILNAYYLFNPSKFSYSAAMSGFMVQKKSAGSFLAGLTLNQTRIRSYEPWLSYTLGRVNRIKIQQFAVGAGYAYNWVPVPRLTLHLSEIPMLLVTMNTVAKMQASDSDDGWNSMQKQGYKDLFGGKTHISFSHMFRTSAIYTFSDRLSAGTTLFYNYFRVGKHSSYYVSTEDWSLRFFVAVRF